ncbi:MAG: hypothetical protein QOJ35_682 [Solirubrobacteraceae bacterium]|jgi:hypothetical protein|nr:hypothetical protein [Solirubrobacteraceae bacterium]
METVAIIAVAAVALLLVGWLAASRLRARGAARNIRRDKLVAVAAGHREMADAHASSVEDLAPRAEGHREAAVEHARKADALEERIERERRQAQFHEERAVETEHERERI